MLRDFKNKSRNDNFKVKRQNFAQRILIIASILNVFRGHSVCEESRCVKENWNLACYANDVRLIVLLQIYILLVRVYNNYGTEAAGPQMSDLY